jgi:two-component system OmpR family response regulator
MKKRILLSDDDAVVREMLGRVLEMEGYAVDFARTGRETVSKFLAQPADLVLLDLNMPEGDGWQAYNLINCAHPLVPVIVITARPQQYHNAADLGIDGLMEKPLNLPLLLATIKNFLSETEPDRVRRLTNPHFRTLLLNQNIQDRLNEIFK